MKALVYTDVKTLKYKDVQNPKLKKNEKIIKVEAAGICGSDMHAYKGLDSIRKAPPLILGHEIVGLNLSSNKHVVINPIITCKKCKQCITKNENLCTNLSMIGLSKPVKRHGGFANYLAIPNTNILNISSEKNLYHAALTEPTAVSLRAVNLAILHSKTKIYNSNILIIGAGAIGLLIAIILQNKGVKKITIIDTNENRLKECRKYSSATVFHPDSLKIKDYNYDLVFDAVGLNVTRKKSLESIREGGVIIHVGLSSRDGGIDFLSITRKEIILLGSFCYTSKEFTKSLSMISKKELGSLLWLDFCPLKDGARVFKEIDKGKIIAPKTILIP
jgi:threonine dehydrogenase-like Zn-dependent dehydrogenase